MTTTKQLAAELEAINVALNPLVERAESAIRALQLGVATCIPIGKDCRLWFGKLDGEWRLYVVTNAGAPRLLTSTSRKQRLEALANLPYLVAELQERTVEQVERAERIVRLTHAYVADLEQRVR